MKEYLIKHWLAILSCLLPCALYAFTFQTGLVGNATPFELGGTSGLFNVLKGSGTGLNTYAGFSLSVGHFLFSPLPFSLARYFIGCIFILAGILGTFFLLKQLHLKKMPHFAPWLAGLLFIFNPYSLALFALNNNADILGYVGLPWFLWSFLQVITPGSPLPRRKRMAIFVVCQLLLGSMFLQPLYFISYLVTTFVFCLGLFLSPYVFKVFWRAPVLGFLVFVLQSYWLLPFAIRQFQTPGIWLQAYTKLPKILGHIFPVSITSPLGFLEGVSYAIFAIIVLLGLFSFSKWHGALILILSLAGSLLYLSFSPNALWLVPQSLDLLQGLPLVLNSLIVVLLILFTIGLDSVLRIIRYLTIHRHKVKHSFLKSKPAKSTLKKAPFDLYMELIDNTHEVHNQKLFTPLRYTESLVEYFRFEMDHFNPDEPILLKPKVYVGISILFLLILVSPLANNLITHRASFPPGVTMPQDYLKLQAYFKKQPGNIRYIVLPHDLPDSPTETKWGYRGSNFYSFLLPQTELGNPADYSAPYQKSVYWEVKNALDSRNPQLLQTVLNKFQIDRIVIDGHKKTPVSNDLNTVTSELPQLKKDFTAGLVTVYSREAPPFLKNGILLTSYLPNIGPAAQIMREDSAYRYVSNYRTTEAKPYDLYYPYLDFLVPQSQLSKAWEIVDEGDSFTIQTQLDQNLMDHLDNYDFETASDAPDETIINNKKEEVKVKIPVFTDILGKTLSANFEKVYLKRFEAKDAINTPCVVGSCLTFRDPDFNSKTGFLTLLSFQNPSGPLPNLTITSANNNLLYTFDRLKTTKPFYVFPVNQNLKNAGIHIQLAKTGLFKASAMQLKRLDLAYLPYAQLKEIRFRATNFKRQDQGLIAPVTSWENFLGWKIVTVPKIPQDEFELLDFSGYSANQIAYRIWNPQFLAYLFPPAFGTPVGNHEVTNSWANGWSFTSQESQATIVLVEWPRLLMALSLGALGVLFVIAILILFVPERRRA